MAKKSKHPSQGALTHFPQEEIFVKRIWELMRQVDRNATYALTPFLRPDRQHIVRSLVGKEYRLEEAGFYVDAEAKRLAIVSYDADEDIDFELCQLVASYSSKFVSITHQDVLGALMQLGLEREQFGDIAISETKIGLVVNRNIASYVTNNLTQIHRLSVQWTQNSDPVIGIQATITSQHIVSSLRLDTLVSSLVMCSRAKAKEMLEGGLVKVNHSVVEYGEKLCNNMDIISIRGHGRYQIEAIKGMTKKGNTVVAILQFK